MVHDCVYVACLIFFWCSFIYHSYRYFIYAEVSKVWTVMPVDACHAYRAKLIHFLSVLALLLVVFMLLYSLFFILTFTGPGPKTAYLLFYSI